MYSKMAMLDSRWRGELYQVPTLGKFWQKNATKKAQKNYKMATPGLIQGGRGNLLNSHFWRVLKKSHPKSPPRFKMAKWTPKWQHLAQFREGGEIYQILTFGMIWKKSQSKAHIFFKMAKILHTGNTWFESGGEGGIYQIPTYGVFWKKATQKWRQNGKDGLATRIRLPHIGYVGLTTKNL